MLPAPRRLAFGSLVRIMTEVGPVDGTAWPAVRAATNWRRGIPDATTIGGRMGEPRVAPDMG
jgi:hypothetical protein